METANALHMLILPLFQCTAGIFAAFASIHLALAAIVRSRGPEARDEPGPFPGRPALIRADRPASSRIDRPRSRSMGVPR